MNFSITIYHDRRQYTYPVQQFPSDASFDYYKVIGKNGSMVLKNNAPVMRRNNLKHRKPNWTVQENPIWNATFKTKLIEALNIYLGY